MPEGIETLIEREREIFLTLYAKFHYLLTLNEVLLQHFLLIFIIKEAGVVYKIRNNREKLKDISN